MSILLLIGGILLGGVVGGGMGFGLAYLLFKNYRRSTCSPGDGILQGYIVLFLLIGGILCGSVAGGVVGWRIGL